MQIQTALLDSERPQNEVDKLMEKIRIIRESCSHDFKIQSNTFQLKESRTKGVYLGSFMGSETCFSTQCQKCNLTMVATARTTCPKCMSMMEPGQIEDREKYFGEEYLYYGAQLYSCKSCKFTVAIEEWDQ